EPQTNAANPRLVDSPAAVVLQWWLLVSPLSIGRVAAKPCPSQRFFMSDSLSLRDVSVQGIQLELLRRTCFNALDGEQVLASLLKHRHLWLAALLDRPGVPDYSEPGHLLLSGLIKLRDLPTNFWNADTFIWSAAQQFGVTRRYPAIRK